MHCLLCGNLSFWHICKRCRSEFLTPSLTKRVLDDGLEVYSFYRYSQIKTLLHTKHKFIGYFIYRILAKESFLKFADNFNFEGQIFSIACDDSVKRGYSHSAILNRYLKSAHITPLFSKLRAKNSISYSGKSLKFREENPRDFGYSYRSDIDIILVDDIVTTGTTLKEAKRVIENSGSRVHFALTLADARDI